MKLVAQFVTALLAFSLTIAASSSAEETKLPTKFNPNSTFEIRYDDWDLILSGSVMDVGPSDRRAAGRGQRMNGTTKIKHGNSSATAFEGNRMLFSEFGEDHLESLLAIRKDLESVPEFMNLEDFDQWDQLAYWYNLHNVAVVYEIAKAYPIKKIKPLVEGRKAVWDKKTMSIGGVPTSIRDIEQHVVTNWDNPLVLYGFFMGTVGGPNVLTKAYTGDNVVEELQKNAVRFVNSLRGVRLWSGAARVSDHYKMGKHLFPNFEQDLMQHMLAYARPDTRRDLAKAKSIKIKNYDWGIADLKDGSVYSGSSFNTNPGALAFFLSSGQSNDGILTNGTPFDPPTVAVGDSLYQSTATGLNSHGGSIAPQTAALLRAVKLRNERRLRRGEVTVEEFIEDEEGGSRVKRRPGFQEPAPEQEEEPAEPALAEE